MEGAHCSQFQGLHPNKAAFNEGLTSLFAVECCARPCLWCVLHSTCQKHNMPCLPAILTLMHLALWVIIVDEVQLQSVSEVEHVLIQTASERCVASVG